MCPGDAPAEGDVLRYDAGAGCHRTVASVRLLDDWLCAAPAPAGSVFVWNGTCFDAVPLAGLAAAADVAALQADVWLLNVTLEACTGNVSNAFQSFVVQTEADIAALDGRLTSLEADAVDLAAGLANLTARVDGHDADLAALGGRVGALESNLTAVHAVLAGLAVDVAGLQGGLAAVQADVATLFGQAAALGGGLANLTARVDGLEAELGAYRNATDAVLADHEARLAALEAGTPTLLAACNQTAFGDRDLARYNPGGACWEPYRINLRSGQVRINGYNASGVLQHPIVAIGAADTKYPFVYESPLVYAPAPITRWPDGVPAADGSIYNFANDTVIENVVGQVHIWRVRITITRTGSATQAVFIGLRNPISGFVVSGEVTSIPGGPTTTDVTLATIGTDMSVPPEFGGQGIGYQLFAEATSTQVQTVQVHSVVRYSAPYLEP